MPEIVRFKRYNANRKSKTVVVDDTITGKRHIITKANVDNILKENKERRGLYGDKQDTFFSEKHNEGDRVVAQIHKLTIAKMWANKGKPGSWYDEDGSFNDANFNKWLDSHPENKTMDVGWTRAKGRGKHRGGAKDILKERG